MKAPYRLNTPAQIRSFMLLTLAQMVHLESIGFTMTGTSAKKQALVAIDAKHDSGAYGITSAELIQQLREAATKAIGVHPSAEAPSKPIPPTAADLEATL